MTLVAAVERREREKKGFFFFPPPFVTAKKWGNERVYRILRLREAASAMTPAKRLGGGGAPKKEGEKKGLFPSLSATPRKRKRLYGCKRKEEELHSTFFLEGFLFPKK